MRSPQGRLLFGDLSVCNLSRGWWQVAQMMLPPSPQTSGPDPWHLRTFLIRKVFAGVTRLRPHMESTERYQGGLGALACGAEGPRDGEAKGRLRLRHGEPV